MNNPFPTSATFKSLFQRWVAVAALLGVFVILLMSWLHYEDRRVQQEAHHYLRELRTAQIELSKGFLRASLADKRDASLDGNEGVALVRQSIASFERALNQLVEIDPSVRLREAADFRNSAEAFLKLLETWRSAPPGEARRLSVALQIAYGDLERRAARLDVAAERQIDALVEQSGHVYRLSLLGSVLALSLIVAIVLNASRKERRARLQESRAVRTLQESEERYRTLLESLDGAVYRCRNDDHLTLEFASEGCRDLLGFTPDELVGGAPRLGSLIHPDDRPVLRQTLRDDVMRGGSFQAEIRLRHADGSWRWVLGKGHGVRNRAGKVTHIDGFATDITARKTAEASLHRLTDELEARIEQRTAALRRANEELAHRGEESRSLLDNLVDVVILIDSRGIVRSANPALRKVLGYDPGEVIGRNVSMLMPSPHTSAHDGYLERFMRTGEARIIGIGREVQGLHKAGHTIEMELAVSEFRVQGERYFTGILRDVTLRKQAESERRRLTDLLNNVLDAASEVAIMACDCDGNFTIFNSGAQRMFGYRSDEMLGTQATALLPLAEEVAARRAEMSAQRGSPVNDLEVFVARAEHEGSDAREWTFVRKDGARIPVLLVVTPMRSSSGAITGYLGIGQHIGERKRIIRELEEARETAEAASRAKSAFLATMSHEVRTPMNGILGTTEVLARSSLGQYEADLVGTIRDSALNLLSIIDDILDFSKIEAGRMELECQPVKLGRLLESAAVVLLSSAVQKQVRLSVFVDPRLPEQFIADPVRVRQIIFNLGSNAIKFATGTQRPGIVKIRVEPAADTGVRLVVSDNGIGIAREAQQRIFSPFEQADISTTRRFGGTGLGLTICKRLVDLMNGTIEIDSEPGSGATFTVTLPLPLVTTTDPDLPAFDLSGLDIAVLTTNAVDGEGWARYLQGAGAAAHCHTDVLPALRAQLQRQDDNTVVVIEEEPDVLAMLRVDHPRLPRVVWIHGGEQRPPHRQGSVVHIGGVITREALYRAVAIAVGRASPEPEPVHDMPALCHASPSIDKAAAEGRLILVAEDNEINRKVIQLQLKALGCAAEIAKDGKEAFALWQTGRHALLLTDLHMPHMDGYELTAAIRAAERGTRLPIIAFTANNLQGEDQRCIEAGMDGFLPKPVMLEKLQEAVAKWLPAVAEPLPPGEAPKQGNQAAVLDTRTLAQLVGDEPAVIAEFLADFHVAVQQTATEIQAHAWNDDLPSIAFSAHRLKSSARAVGAQALSDVCAALEQASKLRDEHAVRDLLQEFDSAVARVQDALRNQERELPR